MSVFIWSAFIIVTAVEAYIIFRFARQREWALLKAVVPPYVLLAVFMLTAHFARLRIPDVAMILAFISLLSHTFLGFSLRLYERSKTFDRYVHALGCFAYGPVAYFALASLFNETIPTLFAAIIIASMGITLGVFVEIIEFAADSSKKKEIKQQKGLRDTNFDLIFDVIGAALGGAFAYFLLL